MILDFRLTYGRNTNLECNKPNTFHRVSDEKQILEGTKGRDVDSDIHERDANKTLVRIKGSHEDLASSQPQVTNLQHGQGRHLLTHR